MGGAAVAAGRGVSVAGGAGVMLGVGEAVGVALGVGVVVGVGAAGPVRGGGVAEDWEARALGVWPARTPAAPWAGTGSFTHFPSPRNGPKSGMRPSA